MPSKPTTIGEVVSPLLARSCNIFQCGEPTGISRGMPVLRRSIQTPAADNTSPRPHRHQHTNKHAPVTSHYAILADCPWTHIPGCERHIVPGARSQDERRPDTLRPRIARAQVRPRRLSLRLWCALCALDPSHGTGMDTQTRSRLPTVTSEAPAASLRGRTKPRRGLRPRRRNSSCLPTEARSTRRR